jgi:hypothetical protein
LLRVAATIIPMPNRANVTAAGIVVALNSETRNVVSAASGGPPWP